MRKNPFAFSRILILGLVLVAAAPGGAYACGAGWSLGAGRSSFICVRAAGPA